MPTTTMTDDPGSRRYELRVDGDLAVTAEYRRGATSITFTHTVTEEAHRGQGLAGELVAFALAEARGAGLAVLPECPFVRQVIAEDADLVTLVPEEERARFGL